jgi:hypothetical protein
MHVGASIEGKIPLAWSGFFLSSKRTTPIAFPLKSFSPIPLSQTRPLLSFHVEWKPSFFLKSSSIQTAFYLEASVDTNLLIQT